MTLISSIGRVPGASRTSIVPILPLVKALRAGLLAGLALLVVAGPLWAQQIPTPAEPRPGEPPSVRPRLSETSPDITVRPLGVKAPPGADRIIVDFAGLVAEGMTQYAQADIAPLYEEYAGKQVPLSVVFEIAGALQRRYREDGFLLARVVVPQQSVTDGIYKLQVVEGYIESVVVEGDAGAVMQRVEQYLQRVVGIRPIDSATLERYLLLANDLPGVSVAGLLQQGTDNVGSASLVVRAQRKSFDAVAWVNNRGSRFTGRSRAALAVAANSFLATGERTEILLSHTVTSQEQQYAQLRHQQSVGDDGLTWDIVASFGNSEPGLTLEPLDAETRSSFVGAGLRYPVVRSRKANLWLSGGFDVISSVVELVNTEQSDDDLRVLHADVSYDFADPLGGRSQLDFGIRQGLSAFGASRDNDTTNSRPDGDSQFALVQAGASSYQRFFGDFGLALELTGQLAFNTLLADEEFRVGGERVGRGYDPSELAGEHGVGWSSELQFTRSSPLDWLDRYQLYGYYDFGVVWNDDGGATARDSLASVGAGVRTQLFKNLSLELEVAQPLTRKVGTEGDESPRYFFQILASY